MREAALRHGLDPETAAADVDRPHGLTPGGHSVDELVSRVEIRLSDLLVEHGLEVDRRRRIRESVRRRFRPAARP
jgi:hypothetical protein